MSNLAYSLAWLPFLDKNLPDRLTAPLEMARFELSPIQAEAVLDPAMGESYRFEQEGEKYRVIGGESGVLYGAYALRMALQAGDTPILRHTHAPRYALRMLNCWDNPAGDVERGYAGRSLFFADNKLCYDPARIRALGRMLASVGINTLCINNVNANPPANKLIEEEWLPEVAALASLLRPFGIRLILSIDYATPTYHGVPTADPLDAAVQAWWLQQVDIVYKAIPDLAGFLVKADSEHRPGPFSYGRDHAQGANMLARALKPHGGKLIWRCFVYNCKQDWRDTSVDRPCAAYDCYAPLDGQFDDNVILQIKNGPFDFQVREPISPLLYAMPSTSKAMEVQLAQEYTGHQIDLYGMPVMWRELFDQLPADKIDAVAAVSNLGNDANWTGHAFAQANLFAYGLMAWNPDFDPETLLTRWARLTYALPRDEEEKLVWLLSTSREAYEKYTAPLGICWMVTPHTHYGPSPDGYEYSPWGTFHKADRNAIGIDRTKSGTGYLLQYPADRQAPYDQPETCPERMLLFYHRLPYTYRMRDGRTLAQRIYDDHFEGVELAERMADTLSQIADKLPEDVRENVQARMERQLINAREWRDVINTFIHRFSGIDDEKGRTIYA